MASNLSREEALVLAKYELIINRHNVKIIAAAYDFRSRAYVL